MPINEQMFLIWRDAVAGFWLNASVVFAAFAVALFLASAFIYAWPNVCKIWDSLKCWRWSKLPLVIAFCGIAQYGSTKNAGILSRVYYHFTDAETRYIVDNGSFVTNGYIHIDFTRYVAPGSAELRIDYYPLDTPNDEIDDVAENLVTTTFDDFPVPADVAFENATNYHFVVYTTWTPGPSVHTNGVLQLNGRQDMGGKGFFVPSRTGIYENAAKLAPSNVVIEANLSMPPPPENPQGE